MSETVTNSGPGESTSKDSAGEAVERFYASLSALESFRDVADLSHYRRAPSSWLLIITDVRGSTKAIEAGRYKDVNALGVASIVALRNAMPDVEIPFIFGGDGATLLAPSTRRAAVEKALRAVKTMATSAFSLEMRTGVVPVAELDAEGHEVLVAKYGMSASVAIAMLAGSGLSAAEARVKDPARTARYDVPADGDEGASFAGFECRWQPIPARRGLIVSLLVRATTAAAAVAQDTYMRTLLGLERLLRASPDRGCPVSPDTLRLAKGGQGFDQEAKVRSGGSRGVRHETARFKALATAAIGSALMRTGLRFGGFDGSSYKEQVVANTDYRKFDDTLRMVLDVSEDERAGIEAMLAEEQAAGRLQFGIHVSTTALMTCVVDDYTGGHLHFVDGSDGGYALAAKRLKAQAASRA